MEILHSQAYAGSSDLSIIEEDNDFYEEIEAPKFVDFTAPDQSCPDDRTWFCARIGCDQEHEEIDQDALYKKFVYRVMAARSPSVKLQRILNPKAPRLTKNCPQSAPAKSTKERVSRMNTLTLTSDKMGKNKLVKDHPISSLRSTPKKIKPISQPTITSDKKTLANPRTKERVVDSLKLTPKRTNAITQPTVTSNKKSLTTPRTRKILNNQDVFLSVKHHKDQVDVSMNRSVAKVLFAESPKKVARKNNLEKIEGICGNVKEMLQTSLEPISNETISHESSMQEKSSPEVQASKEEVSGIKTCTEFHVSDENKENASENFTISNLKSNTLNSENEKVNIVISENIQQKVTKVPTKVIPDKCAQGAKAKRTTNPKPFRLRTNERGILKEANLERRLNLESHKEMSSNSSQPVLEPVQEKKPRPKRVRFVESRYANFNPKYQKPENKKVEQEPGHKSSKIRETSRHSIRNKSEETNIIPVARLRKKDVEMDAKARRPTTISKVSSRQLHLPKSCVQ